MPYFSKTPASSMQPISLDGGGFVPVARNQPQLRMIVPSAGLSAQQQSPAATVLVPVVATPAPVPVVPATPLPPMGPVVVNAPPVPMAEQPPPSAPPVVYYAPPPDDQPVPMGPGSADPSVLAQQGYQQGYADNTSNGSYGATLPPMDYFSYGYMLGWQQAFADSQSPPSDGQVSGLALNRNVIRTR